MSPALLLLLRSGLAVCLCGTSGQCGLDLSADACGSLIAERIRAARRVSVYARLVLLEAGVRVAAAASAARIISVVSALAGARCGCLRLLLVLLLGGLLAAGRTLGIRSRLTRLLLGFLFAGHICGDLLGGGVLGDRLAAGALVGRPALTGLALLLLLFLVRNLTGNRNALADQLFDILEVRTLRAVAEGNRGALLTGTAGAADTVHIGFRNVRQVKVDNERQVVDVDAARGNVGRNQNRDLALLKVRERTLALILRLVAVDGLGLDARTVEVARDPVCAVLGAGEHQNLVYIALTDDIRQKFPLFLLFYKIKLLLDLVRRFCARRYRDMLRLMQHFLCQIGNLRRNGSREQQGLALFRQELDDALDIRKKAHIEHAVGLVEHEKLCLVQLYDLLAHQIPQTARRGNENIHTAFDRLDLRHLRYAAEDDRRTARHVARVLAHVFVNLQRKLARRREDERTDGALSALALCQALDDRHCERTGLARAGLGAAHQVAALEHRRYRLLLNRRRLGIACLLQCLEDVFLQLEFVKFHGKYSIPFAIFGMQSGKSRLPADWVLCYTYYNCL